ncbi:MAG: hypothetical protein ABIK39_06410 [candidate division WOR-3 bacterium]
MEGLITLLNDTGRRFQKAAKLLSTYQRLMPEPVKTAHERERTIEELEKLIAGFPEGEVKRQMTEWIKTERERVARAKEEFRFEFGRQLVTALDGSGLKIQGQLPLLRVGLFSVRVDFTSGKATIFWGPEVEKLKSNVKLEPPALAKLLRAYQESLAKKGIKEPMEFLTRLWNGYQRVCLLRGISEGERIFLIDLLEELVLMMQPEGFKINPVRERFVEYPRIRFSYDLYLLKRSGVRTVAQRQVRFSVANFDATPDKAKALWVPDNEEGDGTYYSYISFVRE